MPDPMTSTYEDGGLLWKPIDTGAKRLPLLIALRGGTNKFGPMQPWTGARWRAMSR